MKNFLTFALKLGIIFIKFAFLMAVCLGKAAFVVVVSVLRLTAKTNQAAVEREAELKGQRINPLTGKVI